MNLENNFIQELPHRLKWLVGIFVIVLSVGYFSALTLVNSTTSTSAQGIVENYNGNEDNEAAEEMKFKKSSHEMLNIIHTHILSMSVIFFLIGLLVSGCRIHPSIKMTLMIEPLLSVLVTFSGIYLIWMGYTWMIYVVMVSGFLMSASYLISITLILYNLASRDSQNLNKGTY